MSLAEKKGFIPVAAAAAAGGLALGYYLATLRAKAKEAAPKPVSFGTIASSPCANMRTPHPWKGTSIPCMRGWDDALKRERTLTLDFAHLDHLHTTYSQTMSNNSHDNNLETQKTLPAEPRPL